MSVFVFHYEVFPVSKLELRGNINYADLNELRLCFRFCLILPPVENIIVKFFPIVSDFSIHSLSYLLIAWKL